MTKVKVYGYSQNMFHWLLNAAIITSTPTLPPVPPPKVIITDKMMCFSPSEPCDLKLIQFIQSAEKSIDIAIFDITHPEITKTICQKAQTIPVRIIVDKRQAKRERSTVKTLLNSKALIRYGTQKGIMHHKFMIIDQLKLQTGSFNYTRKGSSANHENQIYLFDPSIVTGYQKKFDEMWIQAKPINVPTKQIPYLKVRMLPQ